MLFNVIQGFAFRDFVIYYIPEIKSKSFHIDRFLQNNILYMSTTYILTYTVELRQLKQYRCLGCYQNYTLLYTKQKLDAETTFLGHRIQRLDVGNFVNSGDRGSVK